MEGLMMDYPLTTHVIIEYGKRVFAREEIISIMPDGHRHVYTFCDLYRRCKQLTYALVHRLGVKKGDIVGTIAWNHYQHVELYYGIPGAGAVCHPINLRLSASQIELIINHAEDKVLFVDATMVPMLEKIAPLLTSVERFIILNAPPSFTTSFRNFSHYEDLISDAPEDIEWIAVDEKDACAMCYTSGTTGMPKGVLYSHRSTYLHALAMIMPNAAGFKAKERLLVLVPQFHVMAWGAPYFSLLAGVTMIMPSMHLQAEALIKIIQQEKTDRAAGVPTLFMGIYQCLRKESLKEPLALKQIVVGGATMPASLIESLEKEFGIFTLHAWGMTETSPLATVSRLQANHIGLPYAEQLKLKAKQGVELPGVELRLMTDAGTIAPKDGKSVGEIQIRGAWVINGYYKTTQQDSFFDDGWFKTGDVGTIDAEGFMQLTDRIKDLIKSGGEWISSVALEVALMGHPGVKEAAVIAIADEHWGERPLGIIIPKSEDDEPTSEDFQQFLAREFAKYQIPEKYVFVKEIPKTSVGKFDKKEMRLRYMNGSLA
jgi:fatty-acyl-CoA synthase